MKGMLCMPIKIPDTLPAHDTLIRENIFVMTDKRATTQDIRPLKILLLNLMPTKAVTETQILRLLSNTPLQVEITLLHTATHTSKNTAQEHLTSFYKEFSDVRAMRFDGMIVTGAPVEDLEYEDVDYWGEMCEIYEWAKTHVYSSFFICWGAQSALYYYYGLPKVKLPRKLSGVYENKVLVPSHPLVRGFDELFYAPHSRNSEVTERSISECPYLEILSSSDKAGVYIAAAKDGRRFFVMGHSEYDGDTLKNEYLRDLAKGINPEIPENYFPFNNPENTPKNFWRSHAHLLYSNWLNYFVYQDTPYNLDELCK